MAADTHGALYRPIVPNQHSRVTYAELFFDLVFVFAVTQIAHTLLAHFTPLGVLQVTLLFLAVWWVWVFTTWITNWLDPEQTPVRLLLFAMMLGGLVLSTSIPTAFDGRGLWFAIAYVAMQVGKTVFLWVSTPPSRMLARMNAIRITAWLSMSAVFWIAGGLAEGQSRLVLWAIALVIEYMSPAVRFWIPRYGPSSVADWVIEGGHMAERCALFVIIALGESLLVTGATFAELTWDAPTLVAFFSAVLGSILMWWLYFDTAAERAQHRMVHAGDPGRTARSAYTYVHIVIVAGIIVCAVADEVVLMHPLHGTDAGLLAVLAGPACYLVGAAWFKWLTNDRRTPPLSHMVGLMLLAMLAWPALSHVITPLVCGIATTLVFAVVACWETVALSTIRTRVQPDHR